MRTVMDRLTILLIVGFASGAVVTSQESSARPGSWSGVLVTGQCTADEAFAEADTCTTPSAGMEVALYDDTTRQVFKLEPQAGAATAGLGASVSVRGVLDGQKLHVSSLQVLQSIGLAVGQRAPAFSARDQFGREQSLGTLNGPGGTVLLFFRSADW